MGQRRKRWILCSANNGVSVVMYRPILERAVDDPRLRFFHSGYLSHTRRIQRDPAAKGDDAARSMIARAGVPGRILHHRISRMLPFDVYLSPNFSRRLFPKRARRKIQIFHGVSFKNCAVHPEKTASFDRLFLPGPYHRRRFIERGIYPDGDPRLAMVGLPKLDRLVDGSLDADAIRAHYRLDGDRPVILYAPTGDPGNSLFRQGEEILRAVLDCGVQLLVKPHDHAQRDEACDVDWFQKLRAMEAEHRDLRVDLGSDVVPLLYIADLLITDASSVAFEYTLLDRPILFMDVPEILEGPRRDSMDLDTWGRKGGEVVEKGDDLREVIPRTLEHPEIKGEVRRAIAEDLFFDPGNASRRALRSLYDELEMEPPAALRDVAPAAVG